MKNSGSSLAVFVGGRVCLEDADGYSTGVPFIRFLESFAEVYGRITLLVRAEREPGREVYPLDPEHFRVVLLPFHDQRHPLSLLRAFPEIRRQLRTELPRHAAVWVGGPHLVGNEIVRICGNLGVPCFLVVRQNLEELIKYTTSGLNKVVALPLTLWIERQFRRMAERHPTFAVGRSMYEAYGGDLLDHVHEIRVSLLREADIPDRLPERTSSSSRKLLWVGRLSPEKGLPVLFEALAELRDELPLPSLTLVGSGPQRPELESLAAKLGIEERVEFAGYVPFGPELDHYYRNSQLFVLPSLTEGVPQVLLEAMAAGLACVASAVDGIPYLIEDGEDGRLVPAGDPVALRAVLRELLGDAEQRRRLAAAALVKVRSHSMERERDRMVEALSVDLGLHAKLKPVEQAFPQSGARKGGA